VAKPWDNRQRGLLRPGLEDIIDLGLSLDSGSTQDQPASESLWVLTGALISLTMAGQPIEAQLAVGARGANRMT
jgi:hypothetical protein